jgi:hypothetical protein
MTTTEEKPTYRATREEVRRKHTGVRLSDAERTELDEAARREGLVNIHDGPVRSAMLRLRNEYARRFMPVGWRPETETTE